MYTGYVWHRQNVLGESYIHAPTITVHSYMSISWHLVGGECVASVTSEAFICTTLSFMSEPQFWKMSVSTMSRQGRSLCHHATVSYKHISCTHHLKPPKRKSEREREREREREQQCQIGKHLSSVSVTTASLTASVTMVTGDCQASWREGWSKNLQLSLTSRERVMELVCVCVCVCVCCCCITSLHWEDAKRWDTLNEPVGI